MNEGKSVCEESEPTRVGNQQQQQHHTQHEETSTMTSFFLRFVSFNCFQCFQYFQLLLRWLTLHRHHYCSSNKHRASNSEHQQLLNQTRESTNKWLTTDYYRQLLLLMIKFNLVKCLLIILLVNYIIMLPDKWKYNHQQSSLQST